jgi:hypothetical protein
MKTLYIALILSAIFIAFLKIEHLALYSFYAVSLGTISYLINDILKK